METIDLSRRRSAVYWLALSLGTASFALLSLPRGMAFSLQYSTALAILTVLCFRWWTNPVHPGILGYLSPYTIILFHSFFYFGFGGLPRLAFPEARIAGYHNIGASDYYLPTLLLALGGLLSFDLVYRAMSRALAVDKRLEYGFKRFHAPEMQGFLPVSTFFWYVLCMGVFVYMTRSYIMYQFSFQGLEGVLDNTLFQSGYWLVGTAWVMLSLILFKPDLLFSRFVVISLIALLLPVMFAYQNRRIIVYCLAMSFLVYFVYPSRIARLKALVWLPVFTVGGFILMTSVKYVTTTDPNLKRYIQEEKNIFSRAMKVVSAPQFLDLESVNERLRVGAIVRLNGLDWAAAMMEARDINGTPFLWGRHNLIAAATIIPRAIWPGKPRPAIEGMVNRHFELAYFDQLGSLLGSAYADGGPLGVLLGFGFLGFIFPPAIRFIFRWRVGMIVYLGALLHLLSYENFILMYVFRWFRWVLILLVLNGALFYAFTLFMVRRSAAKAR